MLNLTSRVINKRHIVEIVKNHGKFQICLTNHVVDGYIMVGSGRLTVTQNMIEICEKTNKPDYDIVNRFITSPSNDYYTHACVTCL
jgi:hypothetical protein